MVTHAKQKNIWEDEHKNPQVLLQMDQQEASSGVKKFYSWLAARDPSKNLAGIEMGCGKGRNSIWLAQQGAKMTAFDYSKSAITEAKKRAKNSGTEVNFLVQDATSPWPFEDNRFDFAIDCFASTDIESPPCRVFAASQFRRILKKGGHLLVYTLSTDDQFHKKMLEENPAKEKNSFTHPATGKFEKVFDKQELLNLYKNFKWIDEQRVEKDAEFFGQKYHCKHFWLVLEK